MSRDSKDVKKKPGRTAVKDGGVSGFPPAEPITILRVVGRDVALRLSPVQSQFTIGSGQPPETQLTVTSSACPELVSRRHALLGRNGSRIQVHDLSSTNGTYFHDRREKVFEIRAGDTLRLAEVKLLALDEHLGLLRDALAWSMGLRAHLAVDNALTLIAEGAHLVLVGPPGCDQRDLARRIHETSARRSNELVEVTPAILASPELSASLVAAQLGTVLIDLHTPARPSPIAAIKQLLDERYQIRTIVLATSVEQAYQRLGGSPAALGHVIEIPPLAKRGEDVPALLNFLFAEVPTEHRIAELGEARVAALTRCDWPHNLDDLRRSVARLHALVEHKTLRSAARALDISPSSLSEWLKRLGL